MSGAMLRERWTEDDVLRVFPGARRSGSDWSVKCPAHDDEHPSLSVGIGENGCLLVHCHAGCGFEAIAKAAGLDPLDLRGEPNDREHPRRRARPRENGRAAPAGKSPKVHATAEEAKAAALRSVAGDLGGGAKLRGSWVYHDAKGREVGRVLRFEAADGSRKTIRPLRREADGWTLRAVPRVLYGLPDLGDAERVYVVEGEKCADAVRSLKLTATCSPGGANAAGKCKWSPLAGREVAW